MYDKKRVYLIAGVSVAIAIVLIVLAIVDNRIENRSTETSESMAGQSIVDEVSGENIVVGGERDHEYSGVAFIGFGQLIDIGLTTNQVNTIRNNFTSISESSDSDIELVSVYKDSLVHSVPPPEGPYVYSLEFKVQVDREVDHVVEVTYSNLNDVDMKFYDSEKNKLLQEF